MEIITVPKNAKGSFQSCTWPKESGEILLLLNQPYRIETSQFVPQNFQLCELVEKIEFNDAQSLVTLTDIVKALENDSYRKYGKTSAVLLMDYLLRDMHVSFSYARILRMNGFEETYVRVRDWTGRNRFVPKKAFVYIPER